MRLRRFAIHQTLKFGTINVAAFGKSVDQFESFVPVGFQNGPSAFAGLVYSRPMLLFWNSISVEQYGNLPEIVKPRRFVSRAVKDLFGSPTGDQICNFIHKMQVIGRTRDDIGAAVPALRLAASDADGYHGQSERPRHDGMTRLVRANPAWMLLGRIHCLTVSCLRSR
jgi:hypothetical protein